MQDSAISPRKRSKEGGEVCSSPQFNYDKKYNCFITDIDDKFFLFNPHSLATAIINKPIDCSEEDALSLLSEKQLQDLFDNDVLIQERLDATSMSKYYSDKTKYKNKLTISDAMTFSCNMNCIYCFENRTKDFSERLSTEQRIRLLSKLIELYLPDVDCLDYVFFGGEPLLDLDYIESVSQYISTNYSQINVDFSFTSNGTLINDRFISLCQKHNYKEIRITLDGTSSVHNSRRVLKNGQESYDLIIENIKKLCVFTNITIVINTVLDDDNFNVYMNMVENMIFHLGEYILADHPRIIFNIGTLCHPLFETSHTKGKETSNASSSLMYYALTERLINLGATTTSPFYSAQCMNSSEKDITIAPNGNIYKCVTGIGSKHFLLSTYAEFEEHPLTLLRNNIRHIERSHHPQCFECDYLAMCNGGCKCQHYEKGALLCRKDILDEELEAFMRLLFYGSFTSTGLFQKRERPSQ